MADPVTLLLAMSWLVISAEETSSALETDFIPMCFRSFTVTKARAMAPSGHGGRDEARVWASGSKSSVLCGSALS